MLKILAAILACFVWSTPVWADQEPPAVPGTYVGAGLPWSTAHPPKVIRGPGILTDANGRQVDMLGISGGRWGATGDEMAQLSTAATTNADNGGFSFGWLGLFGLLGILGARLRRRSR